MLDLDALGARTSSRPASCLECGIVVRAVEYGGRTEVMPVDRWYVEMLPERVAWEWDAGQGFAWHGPGSRINHVCRPYAVGEPIPEPMAEVA